MKTPSKKITRIFVAKIPSSVIEDEFCRYGQYLGTNMFGNMDLLKDFVPPLVAANGI